MKKIFINPLAVHTEVKGEEFQLTANRMVNFFTQVINMPYVKGKYPRWNDSVRQLMEVAYDLWKWKVIKDPVTNRLMNLKTLATKLCHNLHVDLPKNISSVAHQSLKSGRLSVVDYYAMLWREKRVGLSIFVRFGEPLKFPCLPTTYRGLFK